MQMRPGNKRPVNKKRRLIFCYFKKFGVRSRVQVVPKDKKRSYKELPNTSQSRMRNTMLSPVGSIRNTDSKPH